MAILTCARDVRRGNEVRSNPITYVMLPCKGKKAVARLRRGNHTKIAVRPRAPTSPDRKLERDAPKMDTVAEWDLGAARPHQEPPRNYASGAAVPHVRRSCPRPCKTNSRPLAPPVKREAAHRINGSCHITFCLLVHDETAAHAVHMASMLMKNIIGYWWGRSAAIMADEAVRRVHTPEVFIRGQQVAVLPEHGKSHAIWVSLEHLVPAPYHVPVHVVHDSVASA